MRRVDGILPGALMRDDVVRAGRAQAILRHWAEIVGPNLATRCWPERYDHGVVWIAVQGSAWAQELRLLSPTLMRKLAQAAEDPDLFKELRFGVRPVEPEEVPPKPGPRFPVQPELESMSIREIAERRLKRMRDAEDA